MAGIVKAFNRMYKGGKPEGKLFVANIKRGNETLVQFKKRAIADDKRWNEQVGKKHKYGYFTKLSHIGKVAYKKKVVANKNIRWRKNVRTKNFRSRV